MPAPLDDAALDPLLASALASEVEFLAARAAAVGSSLGNRELRPHGLRVRSYAVLSLAAEPAPPSQRQLADFLRLDPSQIVSIVDGLEQMGLIRREVDPGDRRAKIVVASDDGVALLGAATAAAKRAEERALTVLDDDERAQLRTILRKLAFPPAEEA